MLTTERMFCERALTFVTLSQESVLRSHVRSRDLASASLTHLKLAPRSYISQISHLLFNFCNHEILCTLLSSLSSGTCPMHYLSYKEIFISIQCYQSLQHLHRLADIV